MTEDSDNHRKQVLVLGAGLVTRPLVEYLLKEPDFELTVATRTVGKAEKMIDGHPRGRPGDNTGRTNYRTAPRGRRPGRCPGTTNHCSRRRSDRCKCRKCSRRRKKTNKHMKRRNHNDTKQRMTSKSNEFACAPLEKV